MGGAGHFWWPENPGNLTNSGFKNLKHLQNLAHFYLTSPSINYNQPIHVHIREGFIPQHQQVSRLMDLHCHWDDTLITHG